MYFRQQSSILHNLILESDDCSLISNIFLKRITNLKGQGAVSILNFGPTGNKFIHVASTNVTEASLRLQNAVPLILQPATQEI